MPHTDHLYRVAFHLVKDPDQANDCVQETYLRALSSYQQFSPGTNMKAWLTRILYNFFFDAYHKSKRMVSVEASSDGREVGLDYWERVAGGESDPEQLALKGELSSRINEALRKIPEEFRIPIVLVDMGDLSYAQAAEILLCPVGTIRSRLSRGRRLLQNHLKEYLSSVGR
jgi:RNA polymerase sigma-70 factor (ECF subfamily)